MRTPTPPKCPLFQQRNPRRPMSFRHRYRRGKMQEANTVGGSLNKVRLLLPVWLLDRPANSTGLIGQIYIQLPGSPVMALYTVGFIWLALHAMDANARRGQAMPSGLALVIEARPWSASPGFPPCAFLASAVDNDRKQPPSLIEFSCCGSIVKCSPPVFNSPS